MTSSPPPAFVLDVFGYEVAISQATYQMLLRQQTTFYLIAFLCFMFGTNWGMTIINRYLIFPLVARSKRGVWKDDTRYDGWAKELEKAERRKMQGASSSTNSNAGGDDDDDEPCPELIPNDPPQPKKQKWEVKLEKKKQRH